jgi:hypothetical protein
VGNYKLLGDFGHVNVTGAPKLSTKVIELACYPTFVPSEGDREEEIVERNGEEGTVEIPCC